MNAPPPAKRAARFDAVVARLTAVNLLPTALAAVTSPILARALGPAGRGQVAAVFAILTLSPWITELGMSAFVSREHARRGTPLGELLGSTMAITMGGALVGVVLAVPLAHLVGHGRHSVTEFLEIGLFLLPANVFGQTLYGIAIADQRWNVIMASRLLNSGGPTVTIVALSLAGNLTVAAAAATYVVWGIIASLPFLVSLRGSHPWSFSSSTAQVGLAFGLRSWLSTLANAGNTQLDQVLMAGLVSSRQLGLYSLAVTLATASAALTAATANALAPRIATGETELVARACRVTLLLVIVLALAVSLISPLAVPVIFGDSFRPMIPMLVILLAASVFYVPGQVLGGALVAGGNPAAAARGQTAGLLLTVPALIIVLPFAGGIGAACISLASYSLSFAIIVTAAARTFHQPYRGLLVVNRTDAGWLRDRWAARRSPPA
jgi:O-antigen/teichoic acid export membrane protein